MKHNDSKKSIETIIQILKEMYPDATCSLDFTTPFEMGIAVMLSAQCTDERVNKTTPYIFKKYNTPKDFVDIDIKELEKLIYPCGFYKNKAKNIKAYAKMIIEDFNGNLPQNIKDLIKLPRNRQKKCKCNYVRSF